MESRRSLCPAGPGIGIRLLKARKRKSGFKRIASQHGTRFFRSVGPPFSLFRQRQLCVRGRAPTAEARTTRSFGYLPQPNIDFSKICIGGPFRAFFTHPTCQSLMNRAVRRSGECRLVDRYDQMSASQDLRSEADGLNWPFCSLPVVVGDYCKVRLSRCVSRSPCSEHLGYAVAATLLTSTRATVTPP